MICYCDLQFPPFRRYQDELCLQNPFRVIAPGTLRCCVIVGLLAPRARSDGRAVRYVCHVDMQASAAAHITAQVTLTKPDRHATVDALCGHGCFYAMPVYMIQNASSDRGHGKFGDA
jgi:hypothetical protein